MKIHPRKKSEIDNDRFLIDTAGKFFLVHENEPNRMVSVLFDDLEFIKKIDLNREGEIKMYSYCLQHNIPIWEMEAHKEAHKKGTNRKYHKLTPTCREVFQRKIDAGNLIVCVFID